MEEGVPEALEEWKMFHKRLRVEGGIQEALEEWKEVFQKRWKNGMCSRSDGGVEGGV